MNGVWFDVFNQDKSCSCAAQSKIKVLPSGTGGGGVKQNDSRVEDISKYNPNDLSHILANFRFLLWGAARKYGKWEGRREI